ncbi:hypothetical protein HQO12_03970 [Rhodococcus fascians]|uniref:hypothetical protein n=1 Tax=Rhodococcoides fascians TaxID=1828 RepID=UPI0019621EE8|nr:hypothetical protein [Rhodococcus fascians]MBM7244425.1 hypothetical protein [Rhodococcus fascians]MBY3808049.1 hypothetical protein [Rhodococcus fascians]MBY3839597.1 hypothetical protein [Rhodococcus fascians]MBY3847860.1 hypothetical protein [Rhodococcus fascians]MBY3851348.1 hypothetical protein [Rhodococcus fascians]
MTRPIKSSLLGDQAYVAADTARLVRKNLIRAASAFLLLMAVTLTTLFTPIFDGHIGGVGIAYIVGFLDFVVVLVIAAVHCVENNKRTVEGTR